MITYKLWGFACMEISSLSSSLSYILFERFLSLFDSQRSHNRNTLCFEHMGWSLVDGLLEENLAGNEAILGHFRGCRGLKEVDTCGQE